ncbi:hypothetical protein AB833_01470 [Chromatiales bacterium (ex Bugula neritina AB1)]|nr:hypothetical protein AB833_01470 [Chromatiales bacterium (ex Bugula neritina AB1)]
MSKIKKSTVGRNDPCPCGSGKKYKKCCLNASRGPLADGVASSSDNSPGGNFPDSIPDLSESDRARHGGVLNPGLSGRVNDDLKTALASQQFQSVEQAREFVQQHMENRNRAGVVEFHGLSPEQIHSLINNPFDSPALLEFPDNYQVDSKVPYVFFFNQLVTAIGNKDFKPTATGNLPRNFCRLVAFRWLGEMEYAKRTRYGGINSETDFFELNGFRHVCEFAGYLRKYRGKYIIGKECQQLLKAGGQSAVYRGLFKAFITELDWGYGDGYPDQLSLIQRFWAFSLYLLQQFGDEWRPTRFYEDAFLLAFPALADPALETQFQSAEEVARAAFRRRVLVQWMPWFGLAQFENPDPDDLLSDSYRVRKTPLADQVAVFTV